ncbi:MAG: alpha/beta hydrolase-fold protein [Planctomycetota bacterium]|nr:esterase family protein [Pirellulaceae bacterium]MEE2844075.1 alpha/beta hydrolase-fold protein [Planctomycetota bacterium]
MWSNIEVRGHQCEVFEPVTANADGPVVIYLHGVHLGRLQDKPVFTEQFEKHGLRVIGPRTQRSWWTDVICEEFDSQITAEQYLLEHILPFIEQQWGHNGQETALMGTSMGGQGALRFAYKYPNTFPIVAAISPAIDYHLRMKRGEDETLPGMYADPEDARQDTALLHIHPLNWPRHQFLCCDPTDHDWFAGVDRMQMKLYSLGVPHEHDFDTVAGGHGEDYYDAQAAKVVEFIVQRLEQERQRSI